MQIEAKCKEIISKIHPATWILMVLSFFVYSPFLTKQLNCADVNVYGYLYYLKGFDYEDAQGRFLIRPFVKWRNDINSNVLIIGLCILLLCLVVELLLQLFAVKSVMLGVLIGAFLLFSQSTADLFTYIYTADVYCFAFLLTTIAGCILIKKNQLKDRIIAGILMMASIAMYQAYIVFPIFLLTLWFLKELLCNKTENESGFLAVKPAFLKVLWGYITIGISMIGYVFIFRFLGLVGYLYVEQERGSHRIFQNFLGSFLTSVKEAYRVFFVYYFSNEMNNNAWYERRCLHAVLFGMLIALIVWFLLQNKKYKNPWCVVFTLLIMAFLPLILCLIIVLAPEVSVYMETGPLMLPFMNCVFMMFPILAAEAFEKLPLTVKSWRIPEWGQVINYATASLLLVVMVLFIQIFAKDIEMDQNQITLLANRLVLQMEERDDYEPEMKVLVVGRPHRGNYPLPVDYFEEITKNMINHYSQIFGAPDQISHGWIKVFEYYVGMRFTEVYPEERDALLASPQVQEMGIYPEASSMQKIGDVMVIKFSD